MITNISLNGLNTTVEEIRKTLRIRKDNIVLYIVIGHIISNPMTESNTLCLTWTNRGVTKVSDGQCPAAGCVCTYEFVPVCGVDGVTYGNQCAMDCE